MVMLTRGVCRAMPRFFAMALAEVTTPLAMRPGPFVLAREDEDRISFGDVLATIHRLLSIERERLRTRIANLSFDRKHHTSLAGRSLAAKAAHLAPLFHDRASSTPNENRAEPPSTLKIGVPLSKAYNKVPRWSQCLVRLLLVTITSPDFQALAWTSHR